MFYSVKGQIISKGLFGILGFFQKTNKQIRFQYWQAKKQNSFVRFFGRIQGYQKSFRNYLTFTLEFLLQNASKYSNEIFLQMGQAASGPDLAKTQSTTAQNDFHTAHNALMSLGEFDLTLNTGYFSFFVPTATCCCQPKFI